MPLGVLLSDKHQLNAKTAMSSLVQEVRAANSTQLLAFSVVSPKANLGFMLLTPDLNFANAVEKKLSVSLGDDVLVPVSSFYSLTECSEYGMSEDEYHRLFEW
jgi:hydrogen peroxide-dependent heme synthase